jgi:succinyl-CoA synthetase alpha subunit
VKATGADATMIFVPPAGAADAILEAAAAGIKVICCITEGVPVQDMIKVRAVLDEINGSPPPTQAKVLPDRPQLPRHHHPRPQDRGAAPQREPYTNAGCKIGIMPGYIHTHISESKLGKASASSAARARSPTKPSGRPASAASPSPPASASAATPSGHEPHRLHPHVRERPRHARHPDDRRDRRQRRDRGRQVHQAARQEARRGVHRRAHRPPRPRMGHAGAIIGGADDTADAKIKALQGSRRPPHHRPRSR